MVSFRFEFSYAILGGGGGGYPPPPPPPPPPTLLRHFLVIFYRNGKCIVCASHFPSLENILFMVGKTKLIHFPIMAYSQGANFGI